MRSSPDETDDPEQSTTRPPNESKESKAPASSDNGWDSEAPTAVHSRRPLFAGPPRLPTT